MDPMVTVALLATRISRAVVFVVLLEIVPVKTVEP